MQELRLLSSTVPLLRCVVVTSSMSFSNMYRIVNSVIESKDHCIMYHITIFVFVFSFYQFGNELCGTPVNLSFEVKMLDIKRKVVFSIRNAWRQGPCPYLFPHSLKSVICFGKAVVDLRLLRQNGKYPKLQING